jgi:DNA-binding SARP family transcriptional activator
MTGLRAAAHRAWAAVRATLALAGFVALWLIRPPLPNLPASLTSSLTTSEVEGMVLCAAWVAAMFLVVVVLIGAIRSYARHSAAPAGLRLLAVLPGHWPPSAQHRVDRPGQQARYVLTIPTPAIETQQEPSSSSAPDPTILPAPAPAVRDPRTISIAVLGPLAIDGLSRRIKRAATHELLAYLALHPKGASRDELIEAIWPAQDPERTRPRFWQSVTEARKAIGAAWLHEGERYQLDRSKVRVDLDELDQLLTVASDDTASDATTLERALGLWRGQPLEGTDYLWAEGQLRSLSATLLDLLERVGSVRLAHDDARGALQMAEQAIALDQLHEPSWRLALQAEHALGLRESITRRYDDLTRSLDEQLGLEPARETRLVYRSLLGQT